MRKRFFLNCLLIFVLVAVMSTSAFAISESDVESAVSASGKEAVSGNVLVWFLCAIAFLKVSQKIDSFLSSLGLNVGHTGGSMLSEAMIAMRAINTATSAVGSALGSRSRHGSAPASGKPGGGSAAAAGFFSGGLVGMASRKIASDAVRTATTEKNIVQPQQAESTVSSKILFIMMQKYNIMPKQPKCLTLFFRNCGFFISTTFTATTMSPTLTFSETDPATPLFIMQSGL